MSTLEFLGFRDGEQGKMARVETTGSCGIPLNIHIDNAAEAETARPGPCRIDVCAIGYDIQIFDSEAAYLAQEDALALPALIPVGTFSLDGDERFEESPDILFTGSVMDVERIPDAAPDEPSCCLRIRTLELEFRLYLRLDAPVREGCVVCGCAWLFGDLL